MKAIKEKVFQKLNELNIAYTVVEHEAAYTMEACAALEEKLGAKICKNLFLCNRQQTQFYLLMLPGGKRFSTKDFSSKMGISRVSFASDEKLLELMSTTPGSVSVMGLMFDEDNSIQLVIDKDILNEEYIGCHPCDNTSTMKIKATDIITFTNEIMHNAIIVEL